MTPLPQWRQVGGSAVEVYDRYLAPAMFAPWAPVLVDMAGLRPGERVLDVACGTGVVAHAAAERVGSTGRVVGLDINAAMLAAARSHAHAPGAPVDWVRAGALAMPHPDAAFDAVFCQHGLQQFADCPTAVGEMRRVLVPDGRLVVSVWNRIDTNPGMAALVAALGRHVGVEAENNRRAPLALGDAARLREMLAEAAFRDVEVRALVRPARFPSPERFVDYQLAATPLSTLGEISQAALQAVYRDVRAALEPYLSATGLAVPMEALVARGRAQ